MKKLYTTPIAFEEVFLANSFVAKCQLPITTVVTDNKMQCINPAHEHPESTYFSNVWVQGDKGSCAIIVDNDSATTSGTWILGNYFPNRNTTVYGSDGNAYTCSSTYRKGLLSSYYVPSFVNNSDVGGLCYGAYVNKGTTEEIVGQPVFS